MQLRAYDVFRSHHAPACHQLGLHQVFRVNDRTIDDSLTTEVWLTSLDFLDDACEQVSESVYNAYFVDLFVRVSNTLAISMYKTFGYSVYRRVIGYYSGEEDAFGERSPSYRL